MNNEFLIIIIVETEWSFWVIICCFLLITFHRINPVGWLNNVLYFVIFQISCDNSVSARRLDLYVYVYLIKYGVFIFSFLFFRDKLAFVIYCQLNQINKSASRCIPHTAG